MGDFLRDNRFRVVTSHVFFFSLKILHAHCGKSARVKTKCAVTLLLSRGVLLKFGTIHKQKKKLWHQFISWLMIGKNKLSFDPVNVRRVLFVRDNDKFGDMIVATPVFREMKKTGHDVFVVAGVNNAAAINENPYIDNIYTHDGSLWQMFRLGLRLRRMNFDMVVDFLDWTPAYKKAMLVGLVRAKWNVGFDNPDYEIKLDGSPGQSLHMSTRIPVFLKFMGLFLDDFDPAYDLHLAELSKKLRVSSWPYCLISVRCYSILSVAAKIAV